MFGNISKVTCHMIRQSFRNKNVSNLQRQILRLPTYLRQRCFCSSTLDHEDDDRLASEMNDFELFAFDGDTYARSIFSAIYDKNNWEQKIYDEKILSKWEQETLDQNIPKQDFLQAVTALRGIAEHVKEMELLEEMSNQYSDSDSDTENDESISANDKDFKKKIRAKYANRLIEPNIVYTNNNLIDNNLQQKFRKYIFENFEKDINENEIDYHPGSDNMVIDIIHPSLYCYVRGVSEVDPQAIDDDILKIENENKNINCDNLKNTKDDDIEQFVTDIIETRDKTTYYHEYGWYDQPKINKDNVRHQWLPSEFRIIRSKQVK